VKYLSVGVCYTASLSLALGGMASHCQGSGRCSTSLMSESDVSRGSVTVSADSVTYKCTTTVQVVVICACVALFLSFYSFILIILMYFLLQFVW